LAYLKSNKQFENNQYKKAAVQYEYFIAVQQLFFYYEDTQLQYVTGQEVNHTPDTQVLYPL
jgi:hypothetical protein